MRMQVRLQPNTLVAGRLSQAQRLLVDGIAD